MTIPVPLSCVECKRVVDEAENLLFLSDDDNFAFCSELCVEVHLKELVSFYHHFIEQKSCYNKHQFNTSSLNHLLSSPDEVWKFSNALKRDVFCYLKFFKIDEIEFYLISLCFTFERQPSFILKSFSVESRDELENLLAGGVKQQAKKFSSAVAEVSLELSEEDLTELELKKSIFLSNLLGLRKESDLAWESFPSYESCLVETINSPDEVFENIDEEGDLFLTYIKTFSEERRIFYYLVMLNPSKGNLQKSVKEMKIILAFPTIDSDLYAEFTKGKAIYRNLEN